MGNEYFETRLTFDPRRERLWKTLCESYFSRLIGEDATVLELGPGYGHFINNVKCGRRLAIDSWEGFRDYLQPGIVAETGSVTDLEFVENDSVDFAFASNLFEHLTQDAFRLVLQQLRVKIRPGGTLNILQPNYRFCYDEYFDDYTHIAIYSDRSLCDFLNANGFSVESCHPRFLPLTVKSRLPVYPWLIRLYLASPVKFLGKQMLIRARPRHSTA
jgi:SAM-dependent methyltransferase